MKEKLTYNDMLLAFMYAPAIGDQVNHPVTGRVKLEKMLYIFEKEVSDKYFTNNLEISYPSFEPYYFGPLSESVFESIRFFISSGMITEEESATLRYVADKTEEEEIFDDTYAEETSFYEMTYKLTDVGKGYVEERIWALFTPKQKEVLRKFKHQADKISIIGIIKYVCTKYPHMAKGMEVPENFLD